MNAGKLRHRVSIQNATEVQDAHGGATKTWTTAATRWAAIEPLRGNEALIAQQVDAKLSHRITIRGYTGLTAKDRLLLGARVFYISEVRDIEERGIMLEILATEDV